MNFVAKFAHGNGDESLGCFGYRLVSLVELDGDVDRVLLPELLLFALVWLLSLLWWFDGRFCHARRYSATCPWPNVSASSKGVLPQRSFGSNGTLHCSNKNCTQSKWFSDAAKCNAVRPKSKKKTLKTITFIHAFDIFWKKKKNKQENQ